MTTPKKSKKAKISEPEITLAATAPVVSPVLPDEPQTEELPESEQKAAQPADNGEPDRLTIEFPLDRFTPEALENLNRMIAAKEPLIKLALGAEKLPIVTTESTVQFSWFRLENSENAAYYTQFIFALCKTAMEKKRVTAKVPERFENERFTMRVWLIGLGLVGKDFKLIRKLMCQPLSGNAAWRYGVPEKKAAPATEEAGTAKK